jgi:hypothetical protein
MGKGGISEKKQIQEIEKRSDLTKELREVRTAHRASTSPQSLIYKLLNKNN